MQSSQNEILYLSLLGVLINRIQMKRRKKKTRKRFWTKKFLLERNQFSHVNLLNELRFHPEDWHNYLRMDEDTYLKLLSLVTPIIQKKDTCMRKAISPHERLTATLRYLASGVPYECLKFSTIISPQLLGKLIPETCDAIYDVLKKDYLKFPCTSNEWGCIAKEFENRWDFPKCCGAVDGKHVSIVPPANSGSYFFNYKGYHSLVLMAIANANYEFIYVHFGVNGRNSDGGVLKETDFYEKLNRKSLHLPTTMEDDVPNLPYVFIGDEAFMLREDFLKPFSQQMLNTERRIFNYRLSRARRIIENVFGILTARFGIFRSPIDLQLKNIESVVMASCALHNFLRRTSQNSYFPPECFDIEDLENGHVTRGLQTVNNVVSVSKSFERHSSDKAKTIRNLFVNYFNNEGQVPWQGKFL